MKKTMLTLVLMTTLYAVEAGASGDGDIWQLKMLYSPSVEQLAREANGTVMIYDGLTDQEVEQAMDRQFRRVESMMFVRTVRTNFEGEVETDQVTGEDLTEEDGC